MAEAGVLKTIRSFTQKYLKGAGRLKDEQLLGYVVLSEDKLVIVASTFDPNYGSNMRNPLKSWMIYEDDRSGMRAFVMDQRDDFKNFVDVNF